MVTAATAVKFSYQHCERAVCLASSDLLSARPMIVDSNVLPCWNLYLAVAAVPYVEAMTI